VDKITRIKKGNITVAKSFLQISPTPSLSRGEYLYFPLVKGGGFDVVEDGVFVIFNSRLYNDLAITIYGHIKDFQVKLKLF